MPDNHSLINATANSRLEQALRDKLTQRHGHLENLGEIGPLAIQLGLIQNTLKPKLQAPQLLIFAADHGLAVDGVCSPQQSDTVHIIGQLLACRLPAASFASAQGITLSVVDSGVTTPVAAHPRLIARKIAHGTRNLRVTAAMTLDQAHAGIRAGMEIGDTLPGNVVACAGFGLGSHESASLVLAALSGTSVSDLVLPSTPLPPTQESVLLMVLHTAQRRHGELNDVVEILAAWGGFEIAMMVGVMLVAASKRQVIVVDGMPACAALIVASRIAPSVTNYCIFTRSHRHPGLKRTLKLFRAATLPSPDFDCLDGTAAAFITPSITSACGLLTQGAEDEDSGLSLPL